MLRGIANHPLMRSVAKVQDGREKRVADGRMNVQGKHLEVNEENTTHRGRPRFLRK